MSDIKLVKRHSLSIAKARALVQKTADDLAEKYDLTSEWDADTLRFRRQGVDGRMQVTDKEIRLDVTLGFLLKAFKGRLLEHIERTLDAVLAERAAKAPAKKTSRKPGA